jgi:gamma-glutamyltranspeptidase / glutathione hydrolase
MTTTISSRPSTTRRHAALGAVLALLFTQLFAAAAQTAAAQTAVQRAAVAAPDRYGAEVAESVMRSGGNAVDAAVATAFVLAVTFPEAGNLGGGGFITLKMGTATAFLDFREVAPQAASRDMYLDAAGKPIPGASLIGHRAAGVPGTVAGLWEAHRKYGSRPWPELLQPAIRLARDGFVPPQPLIDSVAESLADYAGKTNFAEYFGKVGNRRFKQPELARTLQRIAERGSAVAAGSSRTPIWRPIAPFGANP